MSITPGPWEVDDYCGTIIWAPNPYGDGRFHVADIRGWGHLTGRGRGGMGLPNEEAIKIQSANACAIAAVPEMVNELKGMICAAVVTKDFNAFSDWMEKAFETLRRIEEVSKSLFRIN